MNRYLQKTEVEGAQALSLRPLSCPVGVNPAEWREAVAARIDELQDAMLALIAALDAMEVDPDLEPSLAGGGPVSDDRERDLDLDESDEGERLEGDGGCDDEDGADKEPSMGWSNPMAESLAQHMHGGPAALRGDLED